MGTIEIVPATVTLLWVLAVAGMQHVLLHYRPDRPRCHPKSLDPIPAEERVQTFLVLFGAYIGVSWLGLVLSSVSWLLWLVVKYC